MSRTVIIGTGSHIPKKVQKNEDFHLHKFYSPDQEIIPGDPKQITDKFQQITGIKERRYIEEDQSSSAIATLAAEKAIEDSGIDREEIDQIIFAHNFGDVVKHTIQTDILPALASRVKQNLKIYNPNCTAYDILFGCPGWIQGMIQADAFGKAGLAKTTLVIGAETLSRVLDMHDRDSMIFADGAGAVITKYEESGESGVLSVASVTHSVDEAYYLFLGKSNFPESDPRVRYIKMHGRKVYEYALTHVPKAMKDCLDKSGEDINDLKKIFIHQANEKLDLAVLKRFYRLYGIKNVPEGIMPMSVHELGNSSVATVPTLYDQVRKGMYEDHHIQKGDLIMFASVGAGMNINAITYRV